MARINAYEASDKSLHRDRKAWLQHESNIIVSKELKTIIAGIIVDGDEAAREAAINDAHGFIVDGIGLNKLRELFAIQFKPGREDGEGDTGAEQGAPEAGAQAQEPAAPEAAAAVEPQGGDI